MDLVNEKSTPVLTIDFFDENGDAVIPSKVEYQIDDVASGQSVKAKSEIPVSSSSIDITLSTSDTSIINQSSTAEEKLLTMIYSWGSNKQLPKEFRYVVKNLQKVS